MSAEYVEREAKLFEAGSYEDKGVEVTEDDLDTIAAGTGEVPIKIEHTPTPFDGKLGTLAKVWRSGKELLGKIRFPAETWGFLESTGVKKLSVGLMKDKTALAEVSLVADPRVADAQVFHDTTLIPFSADVSWVEPTVDTQDTPPATIPTPEEVKPMSETTQTPTVEMSVPEALKVIQSLRPGSPEAQAVAEATAQIVAYSRATEDELKKTAMSAQAAIAELQKLNTETLITRYKREGKIAPVMEPFARAILAAKPLTGSIPDEKSVVTFNTERVHFAEVFEQMLEAMPAVVSFAELARVDGEQPVPAEALTLWNKMGIEPEKAKAHL